MILKLKKTNFCTINPEFLKDADIEKVLLSNNISSTEKKYKYFLGYLNDNYKVKPLHKMLKKTNSYVKSCHGQTKWMYFFYWKWWLEKYNTICDNVSTNIKKEFDGKSVYNKNALKPK